MIKIRKNCFETNSSSTHAFVIDTGDDAVKYTKDHFEAFTYSIFPYTKEEISKWDDPVILSDLKDKVRYLWSVYLYNCYLFEDTPALDFMIKLQAILPQAVFCIKFPNVGESKWDILPYLEDSSYVLTDSYGEDLTHWSEDELRKFLAEGVVIFGDRNLMDPYMYESRIDNVINQTRYKKIIIISG